MDQVFQRNVMIYDLTFSYFSCRVAGLKDEEKLTCLSWGDSAQIPAEKLRKSEQVERGHSCRPQTDRLNERAVGLVRILVGYQYCHVTYSHIISSMNLWLSDQSESHILNPVL